MSLWQQLWGKAPAPEKRCLEQISDLQPEDMVEFDFASQDLISNRRYQVSSIYTLDLGGDQRKQICYGLESAGDQLRLTQIQQANQTYLQLSQTVLPEQVAAVYSIDEFAQVLDPANHQLHTLTRHHQAPEALQCWTAPVVRQEAAQNAYRYNGDYRQRPLPRQETDEAQGFSYYLLVSDDRQQAVEAHVYDGGYTEVYFSVRLPNHIIRGLWPHSP